MSVEESKEICDNCPRVNDFPNLSTTLEGGTAIQQRFPDADFKIGCFRTVDEIETRIVMFVSILS
jgi:hypothetical protein